MLSVDQLSKQIAAYAEGKLSLNAFEDWFRDNSHNAHLWGDRNVNDFVDEVESVFSDRYFGKLDEPSICRRLKEVAQEFSHPFVSPAERGFVLFCERSARPLAATAAAIVVLSMAPTNGAVTQPVGQHSAARVAGMESSRETASSSSPLLVAAPEA